MPGHHDPYDAEFKRSVVEYYLEGHTSIETAERFHISHRTVTLWVRDAGQEMRPRGSHPLREDSAMRVHRNGAAKAPAKPKVPEPSPVTIAELDREIKSRLPKDVERVQIFTESHVIVWNSVQQRRALQREARRLYA